MPPLCFKCKKAEGRLMNRDGSLSKLYCSDCFTEFLTRSIRDQLFSHCLLPCDLPVAVGVSGGPHSMLLLHQLGLLRTQNGMRHGAGRVRFVLLPFHLCEEELIQPPPPPPTTTTTATTPVEKARALFSEQFQALQEMVTQQPLSWSWGDAPLFSPGEVRVFAYSDVLEPAGLATLRAFLHHPKLGLTEREDLYDAVRRAVLHRIAAQLCREWYAQDEGTQQQQQQQQQQRATASSAEHVNTAATRWCHLATGESAVRCAVFALQSIVKGEGSDGVLHKAAYRALGAHGVVQLRPLRHVLPREAVLYCRLHQLPNSYTPSLSTGNSLRSVHRTLESFVLQLHLHYRTALFNVLTTTNKLESADPIVDAVVSGELDVLTQAESAETAVADAQPSADPPRKKPRTDDEGATASTATAESADADKKKNKKTSKAMSGRSAQAYRDACLRIAPPVMTTSKCVVAHPGGARHAVCLCVLCGGPAALPAASDTDLTVCYRCECALHQLAAAASASLQDSDEKGSVHFDQLMRLIVQLGAPLASDEEEEEEDEAELESAHGTQSRLVKAALSEADKAAYLLPDDD